MSKAVQLNKLHEVIARINLIISKKSDFSKYPFYLAPSLTALNFLGTLGRDKGCITLVRALIHNTSLVSLSLSSTRLTAIRSGIWQLINAIITSKGNQLTLSGAKALGLLIKRNTTLTELNIDDNTIGIQGCRVIGEALKENSTLITLSIAKNNIGVTGCTSLAESLKTNNCLQHLRIRAMADALLYNTTLTMLDLSGTDISQVPLVLGKALIQNPQLQINLSRTPKLTSILDTVKNPRSKHNYDLAQHIAQLSETIPLVKVLIFGHANAGKTVLVQTLQHSETFNKHTQSTLALDIVSQEVKIQSSTIKKIILRYFDFAGQIEYISSHQLFFEGSTSKENLIYFLCVDSSLPVNTQLEHFQYWLTFIISHTTSNTNNNGQLCHANKYDKPTAKLQLFIIVTKVNNAVLSIKNLEEKLTTIVNKLHASILNQITIYFHFVDAMKNTGITHLLSKVKDVAIEIVQQQATQFYSTEVKAAVLYLLQLAESKEISFINFRSLRVYALRHSSSKVKITMNTISLCAKLGVLSLLSGGTEKVGDDGDIVICLQPALLAKILGSFICSDSHLQMLKEEALQRFNQTKRNLMGNMNTESMKQSYILTENEISQRIMLWLNTYDYIQQIISSLPQLGIAYPLTDDELSRYIYSDTSSHSASDSSKKYYLIPALREAADIRLVHAIIGSYFKSSQQYIRCIGFRAPQYRLSFDRNIFNNLQLELRYHNLQNFDCKIFTNFMLIQFTRSDSYQRDETGFILWLESSKQIVLFTSNTSGNSHPSNCLYNKIKQLLTTLLLEKNKFGCNNFNSNDDVNSNEENQTELVELVGDELAVQCNDDKESAVVVNVLYCPYHYFFVGELCTVSLSCKSIRCNSKSDKCLLTKEQLINGTMIDKHTTIQNSTINNLLHHNLYQDLWSPVCKLDFYEKAEKLNLWKTKEQVVTTTSPNKEEYFKLKYLEISQDSKIQEFKDEFLKLRNLFHSFIIKDNMQNFSLTKIIYLHNTTLRARFNDTYEKFVLQSFQQTPLQFYSRKIPSNLSNLIELSHNQLTAMQRQKVLEEVGNNAVARTSGNDSFNLVLAWHGTTEQACYGIGTTNFRMPEVVSEEDLRLINSSLSSMNKVLIKYRKRWPNINDLGYFGRGIYFTEKPTYGDSYASNNNASNNNVYQERAMLLSYVLMGRVYPIIENPTTDFPSYHAAPKVKEGYDSHYVVVNAKGFPCNLLQKEPSYANELVVFNDHQILPSYIVYFKRLNNSSERGSIKNPTLQITKANYYGIITNMVLNEQYLLYSAQGKQKIVILWLDNNKKGVRITADILKASAIIHYCSSLAEAFVWIKNNNIVIRQLLNNKEFVRFKFISNSFREVDGGEEAPFRLVKAIHSNAFSLHYFPIPTLVFCSDTRRTAQLQDTSKFIFVESNTVALGSFVTRKTNCSSNTSLSPSWITIDKTHWVNDSLAKKCFNSNCAVQFSFLRRKHHCRKCGNVFCNACITHSLPLDVNTNVCALQITHKVCKQCYDLYKDKIEKML